MTAAKAIEAVRFFYDHAGYSTGPGEDTEVARWRCAYQLAAAEEWLSAQPGYTVQWHLDTDYDPEDYDYPGVLADGSPAPGWGCVVTARGESASLWAVTFGGDGDPSGDPYARVVVAELAAELRAGLEDKPV